MKAVFELSPELELRLDVDIKCRLDSDGIPLHKGNDYERHLFARKLKLEGKSREQTREALSVLGLEDVSDRKRERYLDDILDSILVGYSELSLPIYTERGRQEDN